MTIVIEKDVPLPIKKRGRGDGSTTELIRKMDVGDSFVYPLSKRNSVYVLIKKALPDAKWTVRRVSEDQVRCWRVE